VTGICVGERGARRIEPRKAEGDEAAAHHVSAHQAVHARTDRRRIGAVLREGAHRGLQVGHEQRGRHPLAGNVGDGDANLVASRDQVEAVAAKAVGRTPGRGDANPIALGQHRRQQRTLDQARVVALALPLAILPPRRQAVGDFAFDDLAQRRVVPCFWTKLFAPRRMASTAVSTLPQPVMTTIGRFGSHSRTRGISASPSRPDVVSRE
jgi:hypothetical protein